MKVYRLNDKELIKWFNILGYQILVNLYIQGKIYLTQKQLDKLIEMKNNNTK